MSGAGSSSDGVAAGPCSVVPLAAGPAAAAATSEMPVGISAKIDAVIAESAAGGLLKEIESLKQAQTEARKARQKLARDLRNAQRRKRRLKVKARMLSNDDLVAVLMMRKEAAPPPAAAAPDEEPEPFAGPGDDEDAADPPAKAARVED